MVHYSFPGAVRQGRPRSSKDRATTNRRKTVNANEAKTQAAELFGQAADLLSQAEDLLREANLLDEYVDETEVCQVGNSLECAREYLQEVAEFCENDD